MEQRRKQYIQRENEKLDKALDLINAKYGSGAVKRASLLNENRTKINSILNGKGHNYE